VDDHFILAHFAVVALSNFIGAFCNQRKRAHIWVECILAQGSSTDCCCRYLRERKAIDASIELDEPETALFFGKT
jgi:hypothetical protein